MHDKIHIITDQAGKRSGLGIALYPGQHCFQAFMIYQMHEILKKNYERISLNNYEMLGGRNLEEGL
jgi:hypothetical protein